MHKLLQILALLLNTKMCSLGHYVPNIIINYCHRSLILFSLKFCKFIPIIQGLVQNSLIIFQKQEQIMVYSISDFKVHQYGIPLTKISNYFHYLCLKRKWNSTLSKITRHLYNYCLDNFKVEIILFCNVWFLISLICW